MKKLFETAEELQKWFQEQNWKFCFIGGLALQRWGENRLTKDIDVSLLTGFKEETKYIEALLKRFIPRREDAFEFAQVARVVLLETEGGVPIDVALAGFPFEEDIISRSSFFSFLPTIDPIYTCSAEDLVVLKAFASRLQDWVDVRGVIVKQGKKLNRSEILERLIPLAEIKEEPEIIEKVKSLFAELV